MTQVSFITEFLKNNCLYHYLHFAPLILLNPLWFLLLPTTSPQKPLSRSQMSLLFSKPMDNSKSVLMVTFDTMDHPLILETVSSLSFEEHRSWDVPCQMLRLASLVDSSPSSWPPGAGAPRFRLWCWSLHSVWQPSLMPLNTIAMMTSPNFTSAAWAFPWMPDLYI